MRLAKQTALVGWKTKEDKKLSKDELEFQEFVAEAFTN